ncbi:DUF4112 domain-containing protein [Leptolyngbya sp. FACHB-321]|uniref:DUF4112 domain-containing protein n=1 Tax=Leptolyngbya sp. FACHB-321 TaxID=2692807 RepID=UPI001683481E|nr:DUF4112 domain-containing protein [Leptolyngbya sp. FACHB-321]MBD2035940.1 DUF4112 domain-containing protein [Leptolyngbya sp. FACHB-321]
MHNSPLKVTPNHPALRRVRTVSRLLDNAIPIPGTRFRLGLDPVLGLLPGAGDFVGAALSVYIVIEAVRFGLPRKTLVQMVTNLVLDSVGGSVPILGDVFDATWKANSRNLALLEAHVATPEPAKAADRRFVIFIVLALLLLLIGIGVVATLLISWVVRTLAG